MTEEKQKIREFWDYRSCTFDRSPGHTVRSIEEENAWKLLFAQKLENCHYILDIGAGTGFLSIMLTEMGYHMTGIDLSEKMLARASLKARDRGFIIDFHVDDAENLHFHDCSFDAVVNRAVLWTLPHPDRAVREWMRVLRPGGKLCFFLHGPHDFPVDTLRRNLVNVWALFSERRNPWRNLDDKGAGMVLPFKGGVSPDIVISLLREVGYADVQAGKMSEIDGLKQKHLPFMYRLGNRHGQYWYTGRKPGGNI
jgi:ubiquinone/menaquinone biosynthesis C-methylase UbiE